MMKKTLKILAMILIAGALMFTVAQPVVLAEDVSGVTGAVKGTTSQSQSEMTSIGSKVTGFIWVLSIIVAVIVLMYIGLKFIVGSASEKAEYKKSLMPLVVGVVILVFATTIVNALFSLNS